MFCSNCGVQGSGKFCSACGTRLLAVVPAAKPDVPTLEVDWQNTTDYELLLSVPQVRERIARSAAQSKKRMTGEEFLDLYGNALGKLGGVPLPMGKMAPYIQSMWARLGMKTGKSRSQFVPAAPGTIVVSLLCSLARNGRELRQVQQLADGCIFTAALPSDFFALEGDLIVAVARHGSGTQIDAHTDIRGQAFDWGKSTRCLEQLFDELSAAA